MILPDKVLAEDPAPKKMKIGVASLKPKATKLNHYSFLPNTTATLPKNIENAP